MFRWLSIEEKFSIGCFFFLEDGWSRRFFGFSRGYSVLMLL